MAILHQSVLGLAGDGIVFLFGSSGSFGQNLPFAGTVLLELTLGKAHKERSCPLLGKMFILLIFSKTAWGGCGKSCSIGDKG